jgi:hypothetical protein
MVLAAGASRARAQDTVVVGVGGALSAPLNETVRVPVFADLTKAGTNKLGSYTVRVSWNPAVLSFSSVDDGAFAVPAVQQDSVSQGIFWASGISATGMGGLFNLFDLELSPYAAGPDTVRLQVTELSAAGTFNDLLASATVLTRDAPFCDALGRWGDLDGDRLANSRDALAILSNLVGLPVDEEFNLALGDVDGDGLANSRDALILLSYAVGLDIPGQRVLLVAAGACTGSVPQFTAAPDTVDLTVDQSVRVIVFGRDPSGRLASLNNLQWSMADPRVAVVDPYGNVTGRDPGSTVLVAAIGPGAQVNIPVVIRSRRGTWYVNAARAKGASVQLGTQKWPFATPEYAFGLVSEGDTIRVAPGVVDYEFDAYDGCEGVCSDATVLQAGVLFIGDTLPDGTRPVLRAREPGYGAAFPWAGGGHGEVRNLILQGFNSAMDLFGLRSLTLSNVQVETSPVRWGRGVAVICEYYGEEGCTGGNIDTLVIRNSVFRGDTLAGAGDALYVERGAGYVEVHDSRFEYWDYGLELYGVDSLDVLRGQFTRNNRGIWAENCYASSLGARIAQSQFINHWYQTIYLDNIRRAGLDHNRILTREADAVEVYGPQCEGDAPPMAGASRPQRSAQAASGEATLTMLGDSIRFRADYYHWLNTYDLDSVLVDSLWLESPADTAVNVYGYVNANYARFANSKLLNLYNQGFNFDGLELVVDGTQFTGCAVCDWSYGSAISAQGDNGSGPRVRVANSSFFNFQTGLSVDDYGNLEGPVVVTGNAFDSVGTGLNLRGDSLVVTDNVFTNVKDNALAASPALGPRPFIEAQILRNQVTCAVVGATSYGLRHDYGPARFEGNSVRDCQWGLYAYNSGSLANVVFRNDTVFPDSVTNYRVGIRPDGTWRPTVIGNRIVGGYYGIDLTLADTAGAVVDSNAVSATGAAGIDISVGGAVTGTRNNISANLLYGIYNQGTGAGASFTLGRFVGNGSYSVYSLDEYTFGAQQNWWGDPAGPGPGADSVSGSVDASSPLDADPGDVPALAPRLFQAIAGAPRAAGRGTAVQPSPAASPLPPPAGDRPADVQRARATHQAARVKERSARRPPGGPPHQR